VAGRGAFETHSLLICLPTLVFGGHERMLLRIVSELAPSTARPIRIACAPLPQLLTALDAIPRVRTTIHFGLPGSRWRRRLQSLVGTWSATRSVPRGSLILFAPGVIQVQLANIALARLMGRRPLVYVPMCFPSRIVGLGPPRLRDWATRRLAPWVEAWVTITRAQERLLREVWGVRRPVHFIPNVTHSENEKRLYRPDRAPGVVRFVFLGRFDPFQKGLDWFVRALAATRSKWAGRCAFDFYGEGSYRAELEDFARDTGAGGVTVHGWVATGEALRAADVLVLPSRFEGFPLVFIEAVQAGVPVLTTNFDGAIDLLDEGAWLRVDDAASVVAAIERLADSGEQRKLLEVQAQAIARHSDPRQFRAAVTRFAEAAGLSRRRCPDLAERGFP